jgi:preprotein translocase subunit SecE
MAAQSESGASAFDTAKLVLAVVLLVAGIAGYHYFSSQLLVYRVLGVIAIAIAAIAIVLATRLGKEFLGFLHESRVEVRKVVWPTRQETTQSTLVVVALVFLMGIILWFLDMGLFWGVSALTNQGN